MSWLVLFLLPHFTPLFVAIEKQHPYITILPEAQVTPYAIRQPF